LRIIASCEAIYNQPTNQPINQSISHPNVSKAQLFGCLLYLVNVVGLKHAISLLGDFGKVAGLLQSFGTSEYAY
jgi:hypothetical protein